MNGSLTIFFLAVISGAFFLIFAGAFVLTVTGAISNKIRLAVCCRRRGRALDLFQEASWEELREQLQKLGLIFSVDDRSYNLDRSLDLFGFKPSARAFGSWLNQRFNKIESRDTRGEILSWAIDEIVMKMNGSLKKTVYFYQIASERHGLSWVNLSSYCVHQEVLARMDASVRRYKANEKTILQKREVQDAFARAKKTLGTDK